MSGLGFISVPIRDWAKKTHDLPDVSGRQRPGGARPGVGTAAATFERHFRRKLLDDPPLPGMRSLLLAPDGGPVGCGGPACGRLPAGERPTAGKMRLYFPPLPVRRRWHWKTPGCTRMPRAGRRKRRLCMNCLSLSARHFSLNRVIHFAADSVFLRCCMWTNLRSFLYKP